MTYAGDPRGSMWSRWDPHIHAPGTILNDQYRGDGAWEAWLSRIETSEPQIRALGITDYYSVDTYTEVMARKNAGRLQNVSLVFPNIEMRYGIGTYKGSPINVHLLVSPEDPDHIAEIRRFLEGLTYSAYGTEYRCEPRDLMRLGRKHDSAVRDASAALAVGTNQFKVNPDQLWEEWRNSRWVQDNVLIAIPAGNHDGSSGLQADASFASMRKEIERRAHIIFSSQRRQRDFWLGRGIESVERLRSDWGGCKPCLHGSDAHKVDDVGAPELDRFCWIKGDVCFDALRQACFDPEARAFVGPEPPRGALPSQVIATVSVKNAAWLATPRVGLNPGMVGIIGARGSGKTALADMIAAGGYSLSGHLSDRSFVRRARPLLADTTAELQWESDDSTSNDLTNVENEDLFDVPRVRYLSQQFVDLLCSAEGMNDELVAEIERVIYQSHPPDERMGTTSFREFLELRTARARDKRRRSEEGLIEATEALTVERERRGQLPQLQRQRQLLADAILRDKRDRTLLVGKGSDERVRQLDAVTRAVETARSVIEQARRRRQALLSLKDEVIDTRERKAPVRLRQLQQTYAEAPLAAGEWNAFLLQFVGDVDRILADAVAKIEVRVRELSGPEKGVMSSRGGPTPAQSLLPEGVPLSALTLSLLESEMARLGALVGIDAQNARKLAQISEKISRDEAALAKVDREIETAQGADARIENLVQVRRDQYAAIFDAINEEEGELADLYAPLMAQLGRETGALGKLSFSVHRSVDIAAWARRGEELLDLRKNGPFKGHGTLLQAAGRDLLDAWKSGTGSEVSAAMTRFREANEDALREHAQVDRADIEAYREWGNRVAAWLYGTDHIGIAYSVQYDGVDIEQLSPGTRGIVLLLLYLAIDRDDDRPLIIDQPEENLDPKSIFEELVERFRDARKRRQVIIVTHNANLIVNCDVDQVVVATCGPHRPGELPEISYESGGLENAHIRRRVCEILEGGEAAFRERARRLRFRP